MKIQMRVIHKYVEDGIYKNIEFILSGNAATNLDMNSLVMFEQVINNTNSGFRAHITTKDTNPTTNLLKEQASQFCDDDLNNEEGFQ